MAAHIGQVVTFDEMPNIELAFAPDVDNLTPNGPAPPDLAPTTRTYLVPQPGIVRDRRYLV